MGARRRAPGPPRRAARRGSRAAVRGPGTDLRLRIDGRHWRSSTALRNLPDGEVFTGPHEDRADGVVTFTYPARNAGLVAEGIRLVFRAGEVVEATAERGQEALDAALALDAGARRLGEVGIGTNFRLTRFCDHPLLDEKIGGTFHLALGRSYPETGGRNASNLHWDLVCDLRQGGEITLDGEIVQRDGRFVGAFDVGLVDGLMRIAVVSDTHLPRRGRALPRRLLDECAAADLILHAGDLVAPEVLFELQAYGAVEAVRGNCDGDDLASLPLERVVDAQGVRIGMVHDSGRSDGRGAAPRAALPGLRCRRLRPLARPASSRTRRGVLLVNPGSPTDPRGQPAPTMAVLEVADGRLAATLVDVSARHARDRRGVTPPTASRNSDPVRPSSRIREAGRRSPH